MDSPSARFFEDSPDFERLLTKRLKRPSISSAVPTTPPTASEKMRYGGIETYCKTCKSQRSIKRMFVFLLYASVKQCARYCSQLLCRRCLLSFLSLRFYNFNRGLRRERRLVFARYGENCVSRFTVGAHQNHEFTVEKFHLRHFERLER